MKKLLEIQAKPTRQMIVLKDSLSHILFNGTTKIKSNAVEVVDFCAVRRKKIFDSARVKNTAKFDILLNEFDLAVLDAVISEQRAGGNTYTSFRRIYQILGGSSTHSVPKAMEGAIRGSLNKLIQLKITLEMENSQKKTSYMTKSLPRQGRVLELAKETVNFNGVETDAALKIGDSIIFRLAEAKNQILRLELENLDLPIRHTARTIAIKHYIFRRVAEIAGSHSSAKNGAKNSKLSPKITLKDLYQCCGLEGINRFQARNVRELIALILEKITECKIISGWSWETVKNQAEGFQVINLVLAPPTS